MINECASLIASLSDDELYRLENLLKRIKASVGAAGGRIDLHTIIAEMRANPIQTPQPARSPRQGPAARTAREASGGRRYELCLYDAGDIGNMPGLFGTELNDRYEAEVVRVEAMVAAGMSHLEAWERIRQDCRMAALADLGDLGLDDDDSDDPPPRRV